MKTRRRSRPGKTVPPLVEVTASQPVFEFNDVAGIIVGSEAPLCDGVTYRGITCIFLPMRRCRGHILDFTVRQATVHIDVTRISDGTADSEAISHIRPYPVNQGDWKRLKNNRYRQIHEMTLLRENGR
jgi:hypothetical protein